MRFAWAVMAGALLVGACGCGDDAADADAGVDAGNPDASIPDAGRCGGDVFFTAELVDWDSSPADFLGVFEARFSVLGMPAVTATTAPNGRIELCVPDADPFRFDVDAPATYVDGTAIVEADAVVQERPISLRTFTADRAATFYAERGLTYDPARAHILVFESMDRVELTIDRPHDEAQAASDDSPGVFTWAAGNTGRYVLFPNVDLTEPIATLTGAQVDLAVPLTAGELSMVVSFTVFL